MATSQLFQNIQKLNTLKHQKRKGWVVRGVKNPESVAEHAWRSGLIALLLAPAGYDKARMLSMALMHDTSDIYGTHFTPLDKVTKEEKFKHERKNIERFANQLPGKTGTDWVKMWEEMETQSSKEAKLVKDAEILDMLFQALEYQKKGNYSKDLTEFPVRDIKRLKTKQGKKLGKEIRKAWPKSALKKFDASKYHYHY
jgi:putative hydrolase of HD superfamily